MGADSAAELWRRKKVHDGGNSSVGNQVPLEHRGRWAKEDQKQLHQKTWVP